MIVEIYTTPLPFEVVIRCDTPDTVTVIPPTGMSVTVSVMRDGRDGTQWLSGNDVPTPENGNDGDYYLNTITSDIYKKLSGEWNIEVNIKGLTGETGASGSNGINGTNGATWHSINGEPWSELGVDLDLCLNTATGDVYRKSAGVWSITGNIKGNTGNTGINGSTWLSGTFTPTWHGTNGDFYLNTATYDVYFKAANNWNVVFNIKGAPGINGANGTNGTNGTNGATWLSGVGIPSAGIGVNGDFYLNVTTSDIYKKAAGAWTISVTSYCDVTIFQDNSNGSIITGTTSDTQARAPIAIPANTFANGDDIIIILMVDRTATALASATIKLRYNTSNVFSSSTVIAQSGQNSSGQSFPLVRTLSFKSATTFGIINENNTSVNDLASINTNPPGTFNFNVANQMYLHFSIQPFNTADAFRISRIAIIKRKTKTSI